MELPSAHAFRCIFFQKDVAAIANSALPGNKVRYSRPGFTLHHIFRPRSNRLPARCPPSTQIGPYAALNLANS
jgi:hypothetical protein